MDDFYKTIKNLFTESVKAAQPPTQTQLDEKSILEKHKKEIFDIITENYKIDMQNAATAANDKAYLCLYLPESKYHGVVQIDDLFNSPVIKEKSSTYKISSLLFDLQEFFKPFELLIEKINNAMAIIVKWQ